MAAVAAVVIAAGCAGDDDAERPVAEPERREGARAEEEPDRRELPRIRRARCPEGAANCASATGTILYVERVDPDGDGDAHFVLLDPNGVTGPGISVVDVAAGLRPNPLPGPGDALSAAGPIARGSFGQRQIEATVIHFTRRGGEV